MVTENTRSISLPVASATVIIAHRFVTLDATSGLLVHPADGGGADQEGNVIGIALEDSADGDVNAIPVALLDGARLEIEASAEAITVGDAVSTDATGAAKLANATGDEVLGIAITATSSAGEYLDIIGMKAGRSATT